MQRIIHVLALLILIGCRGASKKQKSIEMITTPSKQDSVFRNLMTLVNNGLPDSLQNDSLAFLILPVQISCPSCRKKTIDSIVKHKDNLAHNHFIIISANGGLKTIGSYFREQDKHLPDVSERLIIDSINLAYKYDMFTDNPAIYYTASRKAYKKVLAIPATVRQDLQEFFSGYRSSNNE